MGNSFRRKDGCDNAISSKGQVQGEKKDVSSATHQSNKSQTGSSASKRDFILYGLDYLSDSQKRKELRRKGPGYIRVDTLKWSASYQHFLNRNMAAVTGVALHPSSPELPPTDGAFALEELTIQKEYADTWPIKIADDTGEWKIFEQYKFENLVMSGGGSKGYAYIGSLKVLEDCGILKSIKRIAGSSAGAICAGLLAVGCSPQEIANVFKCDMQWLFYDQKCVYCCSLPLLCHKYYGVHPAKRFHDIYGEHIARKVGNPDITFLEVFEKYGCELHIVVTNVSRMCAEYCNHLTSPHVPVRDAVRMSMSFPVVFRTVRYNLTGVECLYTDGGILDQYPIHCFDAVDNRPEENNKTLGLYVVAEAALDYMIWNALFEVDIPYKPSCLPNTRLVRNRLKKESMLKKKFNRDEYINELHASIGYNAEQVCNYVDIGSFGECFTTAIETLLISQRRLHIQPRDFHRTVAINCGYVRTTDAKLEPGDRTFLITGYTCTQRFLQDYVTRMQSDGSDSSVNSVPASFHTALGSRHDTDVPLNRVSARQSALQVHVTFASSPVDFWVTCPVETSNTDLPLLMDRIEDVYSNSQADKHLILEPEVGMLCVAKYSDGIWYRAKIISVLENGVVQVLFIDYGNTFEVPASEIWELVAEYMEPPPQAVRGFLSTIEPCDPSLGWDEASCSRFVELVTFESKPFELHVSKVVRSDNGQLLELHGLLFDDGIDVGGELVKEGYARAIG